MHVLHHQRDFNTHLELYDESNVQYIIWRIWEKQFLSTLVKHAGAVFNPCIGHFLGRTFIG